MTTRLLRATCHAAIAAACLFLHTPVLADRALADGIPADVPPQRSEPVALRIVEDATSQVHRIVIPRAEFAKLAGDLPSGDPVASAPSIRSIMAALAVSAAVACGLVAFRRGRADRLAAVVLCGLSLAGVGASLAGGSALADLAVPDELSRSPRPRSVVADPDSVTLTQGGKVILEIAEEGEEAIVIVVGTAAQATPHSTPARGR
jgi:hypothetical protein